MFLPNKNGKNHPPNSSEITKIASPPPDKTHRKKTRFKTENLRPKVKKTQVFFHFYLAGPGRAHARTSPKSTVKIVFFEVRRRDS